MSLSKEAIESFQAAYNQDHGEKISFDEAAIMARELVWFFRKLCTEQEQELSPSCALDDPAEIRENINS